MKRVWKSLFLGVVVFATATLSAAEMASKADVKAKSPRTLTINAASADRIIIVTRPEAGTKNDSERSSSSNAATKKEKAPFEDGFSLVGLKTKLEQAWKRNVVLLERFSLWKIAVLFIGLVITFFIARIVRWWIEEYMRRFTSKTRSEIDELACQALGRPAALLVFSAGFFLSALPLVSSMPETILSMFEDICAALAAGSVAWGLYRLVKVINHMLAKLAERTDNNVDDLIVAIVRKSLKVTIIIVSVLFIGQNILGLNITTLLAGAGVAGLAIAFAAQDTIANFFGSIMIILDRPFVVKDRIEVAGVEGIVESVGFRSTKVRRLDGHLVSIPNKNVASDAIRNVTKRPFIKETFNFTLVYDTPPEKVERAVEILHDVYDGQPCMDMENNPPHIVFNSFNDWALNIKVIVWHHPGDFKAFERWSHGRNLEILRRFNAEGIEFAFPTNTTYLAQDDRRKLSVGVESSSTRV